MSHLHDMWLKNNHIEAILFDLDGTLLDTSEGIRHSVRYALDQLQLPQPSEECLREFVGPPIQESLMRYGGLSKEDAQRGANIFRDFYKNRALFEASLYEGIIPLLEQLHEQDIKIGVATYKREDYAIDILKHFGIAMYCNVMHGADNENKLTKADIIDLCIDELGVQKHNIVLVGDTEHDAKGASQAGIKFCAVTWGFGYQGSTINSAYDINFVCNNPLKLLRIL